MEEYLHYGENTKPHGHIPSIILTEKELKDYPERKDIYNLRFHSSCNTYYEQKLVVSIE